MTREQPYPVGPTESAPTPTAPSGEAVGRDRRSPFSKAADVAGRALGALFGVAALLRRGRPLHPRGRTYEFEFLRAGADTGVPWLDEPGPTAGLLRASRAVGLPAQVPDIYGMAIRILVPSTDGRGRPGGPAERPADLLFASTGQSALGRFVLRVRCTAGGGPLTTLLPVRTPRGPLLLRLAPLGPAREGYLSPPGRMSLSYAIGTGRWMPLGTLRLGAEVVGREDDRHDPVLHDLPGQVQYRCVALLREPAYRWARRLGSLR